MTSMNTLITNLSGRTGTNASIMPFFAVSFAQPRLWIEVFETQGLYVAEGKAACVKLCKGQTACIDCGGDKQMKIFYTTPCVS